MLRNSLRMFVIGRYPTYVHMGLQLKAEIFNMNHREYETLGPQKAWELNREFLDRAMASGDKIILVTDPAKVQPGSTLEMELDYLAGYGYLPSSLGADLWEVSK